MKQKKENNQEKKLKSEKTDFWKARSELAMSINNASIDGMIALDTDFKIISCNTVIETWTGFLRDDIIDKPFFSVFSEANKTVFNTAFENVLEGRKFFLPPDDFYLKGHFETHVVPLQNCSGEINGILQIIHDVSHRFKAEDQLRELNDQLLLKYTELQYANEEMATFAKIAAHDLMEPVRKIYMFAEQIKKNEAVNLSDSGKGNVRRMQTSLQRLGLLMDDIVSFLTLSTSKKEMQHVDLNSILSKVLDGLRHEIQAAGLLINVGTLPVIKGHSNALEQIFRQLISNVIKFIRKDVVPELLITCEKVLGKEISFKEARPNESYYCIAFKDNGIGFESRFSERIFELFQQLHPHGAYKGSGKGLAIALKAARLHKGFIKADSEPGQGSTFYCYLSQ
ncbi:PAS domain-containing protein [Flavobacterium endoglycinae]|uniref:histidine kinase n=1 Tax=Flavobacterium endoglycinae TaxID=2816357 RepID=A0ABX7QF05_9FLAO|nr:ATP-binding protein [Flavobacterium endoglycinae]QSW89234.1 PAS domain-containing protein [Flavobacterium endoglycinae]